MFASTGWGAQLLQLASADTGLPSRTLNFVEVDFD